MDMDICQNKIYSNKYIYIELKYSYFLICNFMIMSLDTDILLLDNSLEFHDFSVGITYQF